ncbi:MAG: hypothetical protein ACRC9X_07905 [Bacteroidales bacterium]
MAELFNKSRSTINEHIINIYAEDELIESETMRKIGISDISTKPTNLLQGLPHLMAMNLLKQKPRLLNFF